MRDEGDGVKLTPREVSDHDSYICVKTVLYCVFVVILQKYESLLSIAIKRH
jgi:hypothetical protein